MILSVTLSKPCGNVCEKLLKPYEKIKISIEKCSWQYMLLRTAFHKNASFSRTLGLSEIGIFFVGKCWNYFQELCQAN